MGVTRVGWRVACLNEVTPGTPESASGCARVRRRPSAPPRGLPSARLSEGSVLGEPPLASYARAPLGLLRCGFTIIQGVCLRSRPDQAPGTLSHLHLLMKPVKARCFGMACSIPRRDGDKADSGKCLACRSLAEKRQYCKV